MCAVSSNWQMTNLVYKNNSKSWLKFDKSANSPVDVNCNWSGVSAELVNATLSSRKKEVGKMDTENYFCELILTFKSKQFSEKKI